MSAPMTHIHIFSPLANQRDRFFKPHILTRLKNIIFRWQTDASWWFWADYYYGKEGLRHVQLQHILLLTRWRRLILSSALFDHLVSVSQRLEFEHLCLWLSLSQPHPITGCKHAFRKSASGPIFFSEFAFYVFSAVFVQNIKFRILTSFAAFCRSKCSVM